MADATLALNFTFDDAFATREGALVLKDGKHRPKVCIMGLAPNWKTHRSTIQTWTSGV